LHLITKKTKDRGKKKPLWEKGFSNARKRRLGKKKGGEKRGRKGSTYRIKGKKEGGGTE